MKISGKLEWEDYLDANRISRKARSTPFRRAFTSISVWGFLISTLLIAILANFNVTLLSIGLIIIIAVLAFQYLYMPRRIKHLFYQRKDMSAPFEMELTEEEFSSQNEYGNITFPWDSFIKWEESEKTYVLFLAENTIIIIPKRVIVNSDEQAAIKKLFEEHIEQQVFGKWDIIFWLSVFIFFMTIFIWYEVLT